MTSGTKDRFLTWLDVVDRLVETDSGPGCALQVAAGAALNRETRRRQQTVITY